jgi:hypothetical protein
VRGVDRARGGGQALQRRQRHAGHPPSDDDGNQQSGGHAPQQELQEAPQRAVGPGERRADLQQEHLRRRVPGDDAVGQPDPAVVGLHVVQPRLIAERFHFVRREREAEGGDRVRLRQQRARRRVVDLVEAGRALHERGLFRIARIEEDLGLAALEVQVAVQPVGHLDEARRRVGIELLIEHAVRHRRERRQQQPEDERVEHRQTRAQREGRRHAGGESVRM